jgi:hypothetical protein
MICNKTTNPFSTNIREQNPLKNTKKEFISKENLHKLEYLNNATCPRNPDNKFWKFTSEVNKSIAYEISENFYYGKIFSHMHTIETMHADRRCRQEIFKAITSEANPELKRITDLELNALSQCGKYSSGSAQRYQAIKTESSKWVTAELGKLRLHEPTPKIIEVQQATNTDDFFDHYSSASLKEKLEFLQFVSEEIISREKISIKYKNMANEKYRVDNAQYQKLIHQETEVVEEITKMESNKNTVFSLLPFDLQQDYLEYVIENAPSINILDGLHSWIKNKLKDADIKETVSFIKTKTNENYTVFAYHNSDNLL